jgi:localization factor PodJL
VLAACLAASGCVSAVEGVIDCSRGDRELYVRHDPAAAFHHYSAAAYNNDAEAQHKLAMMLRNGQGAAKDPKRALEWEEKSAAQEYVPAMTTLGYDLVAGLNGAGRDATRGVYLLEFAAREGSPEANFMLGTVYANGLGGIEKDFEHAVQYFTAAKGLGVAVDPALLRSDTLEARVVAKAETHEAAVVQPQRVARDIESREVARDVQLELKKRGFYGMAVDGLVGKGTRAAIRRFQEREGLRPTGRIDLELLQRLDITL